MIIGVPKEILLNELRVAATPQTVTKLINDGHTVLVEKGVAKTLFIKMRIILVLELKLLIV